MASREKPRLISEDPDANIPDGAGDMIGTPEPDGVVYLRPFDVRDGEIGFASDGTLCAVVTNDEKWISLRFSGAIALGFADLLVDRALKTRKVH